ncbi:MAG: metallophosphoesterase [Clostridia bacterium]|nr:metallophosphoesterase [Clostridia bacterium]
MALFSIADIHLSGSTDKPMDIFGNRWRDHTQKIVSKWNAVVTDKDTVVVPGDISWAMHFKDALVDFKLIDSLPGKKIIGKGNHDFWWETMTKMNAFLEENSLSTISFLFNNAYDTGDAVVCGTRGWYVEEKMQNTVGDVDYTKIVNREASRLEISIKEAERLRGDAAAKPILVYFHFPPVFNGFICRELVDVLHAHSVANVYFGHIHGNYNVPKTTVFEGINMTLISADYLNFIPMITRPC